MNIDSSSQTNEFEFIIPANVNTRYEVFPGFGYKETAFLGLAVAVGLAFFFILGLFKTSQDIKKEDLKLEYTIGLSQEELDKPYVTIKKDVISMPIRLIVACTPSILVILLFKTDSTSSLSFYKQLSYKRKFTSGQTRYLYKYESGARG